MYHVIAYAVTPGRKSKFVYDYPVKAPKDKDIRRMDLCIKEQDRIMDIAGQKDAFFKDTLEILKGESPKFSRVKRKIPYYAHAKVYYNFDHFLDAILVAQVKPVANWDANDYAPGNITIYPTFVDSANAAFNKFHYINCIEDTVKDMCNAGITDEDTIFMKLKKKYDGIFRDEELREYMQEDIEEFAK